MKKKILGVFLAAAFISSSLSGCGRDVLSDSKKSTVSKIVRTTESIETTTQATSQTEAQSDFDFEKTLEQTYICGQQLSYPLTWGQFGEDFSIDPEGAFTSSGSGKITCSVNYKGQYLGNFIFKGCEDIDDITDDTEIANIFIRNMDMNKFDIPKISVNGLTLHDTHEDLYEALGKSYEIGVNENQIIYSDSDLGEFWFCFSVREDEDKLVSVVINFK